MTFSYIKTRPKKCYVLGNLDGRRSAMVLAQNLSEACRILNTSQYDARLMGWRYGSESEMALVSANPGVPFYRDIDRRTPWASKATLVEPKE